MHGADEEDAAAFIDSAAHHNDTNYVGAVYGSLLAASVVVGTSPKDGAPSLFELVVLLMATGIVFWLAHIYARLIGERVTTGTRVTQAESFRVARHEWPLVEAAIGPCVVATAVTVLGGSAVTAAWSALLTAIVSQVGWAVNATARAGASRGLILASGVINLALGLALVVLKAALTH
jgi:hypothetical protein